jgi:signal transduction histidine kinase
MESSDLRERTSAKSLRVLLVEDSELDAEVMLDELRDGGYRVVHERVDTVETVRDALSTRPWQLVLCDYTLPTLDALRALAIVKELMLDVPVIVVSGAVGEEIATELMRAGASDFLLKDNLSRLVPAIERELADAKIRRERAALHEQLLLSDRLVQLGTLAASVAHEINNPLTYIMGNLDYALRELSSPVFGSSVPAGVQDALACALEGSIRIRATTEDLRVFSRTDSERPHPVRLKRVIESAIGMAWTEIRHRARLVKDLEDVPLIAANENRLGQVFLNLLINAAQSIPAGNTEDHEIRIRLRHVDDCLLVEVSDTGAGIAREVRDRLFQPFVTTKPKGIGTGLGLSICRKIVREYGGEISAQANPVRGTTFRVRLPLREPESLVVAPSSKLAAASDRRGRVLIVDDEPRIVDLICRELCIEHTVVGVTSASKALSLITKEAEFDAILCDLMMPEADGVHLYRELERRAPDYLDRIVFMTGGPFTPAAREFIASLPNMCLQKPIEATTLSAAVREVMARNTRARAAIHAAS